MTAKHRSLRLLLLSPFAPRLDAPHGGGRSIAQLVTELGPRHRVALLCLRRTGDPPSDELVRARCELVEEFEVPGVGTTPLERWRRRLRLFRGLTTGRPMWVVDCADPALAARVRSLVESWQPDVVQAEFHVMAQYLRAPARPGPALVLTEHEPGSVAADEARHASRGVRRRLLDADANAWRTFESVVLRDADAVVTYTERDRSFLLSLAPEANVVRIPLGTHLPDGPLDNVDVASPNLLFVGNFMHPPNVDAALRLVREIMPRLAESHANAPLYVVGDGVPDEVRRAAGPNVVLPGLVDDVTPYLARASVVVAPLRTGGGLRVKVMEALAAGKALVASRLAVEGLDVVDGEHVLLAETDQEFADAVRALFDDNDRRTALEVRAREWAESNLGWERTIAEYERLYDELLRNARTRSRR
jgi:polysaccharide biosynthesis protein PslH